MEWNNWRKKTPYYKCKLNNPILRKELKVENVFVLLFFTKSCLVKKEIWREEKYIIR